MVVAVDMRLPSNAMANEIHHKLEGSPISSSGRRSLTRDVRNIDGISSASDGGSVLVRDITFTIALSFGGLGVPISVPETDGSSHSSIAIATTAFTAALLGSVCNALG